MSFDGYEPPGTVGIVHNEPADEAKLGSSTRACSNTHLLEARGGYPFDKVGRVRSRYKSLAIPCWFPVSDIAMLGMPLPCHGRDSSTCTKVRPPGSRRQWNRVEHCLDRSTQVGSVTRLAVCATLRSCDEVERVGVCECEQAKKSETGKKMRHHPGTPGFTFWIGCGWEESMAAKAAAPLGASCPGNEQCINNHLEGQNTIKNH